MYRPGPVVFAPANASSILLFAFAATIFCVVCSGSMSACFMLYPDCPCIGLMLDAVARAAAVEKYDILVADDFEMR